MPFLFKNASKYFLTGVLPFLFTSALYVWPVNAATELINADNQVKTEERPPNNTLDSKTLLRWKPVVDFTYKGGNKKSYGSASMMIPLAQNEDSMIFTDLRTIISDQDTFEGNAGIGFRKIVKNKAVFGAYGFFDARKTEYDNRFLQTTLGTEIIGEHFEARGNVYLPIGKEKKVAYDNGATAFVSGSNIMLQDGRIYESAMQGFDIEVGHNFPILENARGYLGYYSFHNDNVNDINGYRARVEADIGDWVEIGAEKQFSDTTKENSVFGEIRIRIPFDGWKDGTKRRRTMSALQQKMMAPIVRDIDIMTDTQAPVKPIIAMTADGNAPSHIYFVNNTAAAGGDGSESAPFNTLAAAEAVANNYDTIYIASGDGTTTGYDAGITLNKTGQRLIGSGSALTVDVSQIKLPSDFGSISHLDNFTLKEATNTNPLITNAVGDGITITGDNTTITGVTVDGAGDNNIYVYNADNITIKNIVLSNAFDDAIEVENDNDENHNITIDNNTFRDNSYTIYTLNTGAGHSVSSINNNTSINSGGVFIYDYIDGITTTTISNNTLSRIEISTADATTINATITDNTIQQSPNYGIRLSSANSSIIATTITDNTINNNIRHGIVAWADDTSIITSTISNNIISQNGMNGIYLNPYGNTSYVSSTINNNIVENNTFNGLYFWSEDNSTISGQVYDNIITNNGQNGVYVDDESTQSITVDLGGGTLSSTGGNSIYSNTGTDIRVDLDGNELKAENNWWGISTGLDVGETTLDAGSTINADPYLTSAP